MTDEQRMETVSPTVVTEGSSAQMSWVQKVDQVLNASEAEKSAPRRSARCPAKCPECNSPNVYLLLESEYEGDPPICWCEDCDWRSDDAGEKSEKAKPISGRPPETMLEACGSCPECGSDEVVSESDSGPARGPDHGTCSCEECGHSWNTKWVRKKSAVTKATVRCFDKWCVHNRGSRCTASNIDINANGACMSVDESKGAEDMLGDSEKSDVASQEPGFVGKAKPTCPKCPQCGGKMRYHEEDGVPTCECEDESCGAQVPPKGGGKPSDWRWLEKAENPCGECGDCGATLEVKVKGSRERGGSFNCVCPECGWDTGKVLVRPGEEWDKYFGKAAKANAGGNPCGRCPSCGNVARQPPGLYVDGETEPHCICGQCGHIWPPGAGKSDTATKAPVSTVHMQTFEERYFDCPYCGHLNSDEGGDSDFAVGVKMKCEACGKTVMLKGE